MTSIILPGILPSTARIIALIGFGADLTIDSGGWGYTDVAADLYEGGPITITPMGKSDEFSTAQPAACTFMLNDPDGRYSKGPQSSHYPNVRENTPVDIGLTLDGFATFTRFLGYITSFEPVDEPSGQTGWVRVQAFGKTRQLTQGTPPSRSALTRAITGASVLPVAYWPFEDGATAQQANSPLVGVDPATFLYLDFLGSPHFAAVEGPPGCDRLADFSRQADFVANVPNVGTATTWRVQCVAKSNPLPASTDFVEPLMWFTNNRKTLAGLLICQPGGTLNGFTYLDSDSHQYETGLDFADGLWHEFRAVQTQSGGNIILNVYVDGTLIINQTYAGTLNTVDGLNGAESTMANADGFAAGQYIIYNTNTGLPDTIDAMGGHNGEIATDRMIRLCAEENLHGMPIDVRGAVDSDMTMGPQRPNNLMNLLLECAAADGGTLLDGLAQGLVYVPRTTKYTQDAALTLDASAGELAPPVEPKDDDLLIRNYWTVGRRDGSPVVVTDKTGTKGTDAIGFYRGTATDLVLDSDTKLVGIGEWLLALGTVNEPYRYPVLNLDLSAIPAKAADWLATQIGNRIDIINLRDVSTRHPPGPISLILEGYSEVIAPHAWTATLNCTPLGPWNVYALDSNFPLAADGQSLDTGLAAGATTMSVQTAAGKPLLSTDVGDYPTLMDVGGWPIRITAVSGISSPQTCTIDAAPNTSLIAGGTIVTDWRPPGLGL